MTNNSPAYDAALQKVLNASIEFNVAQEAYRSLRIDDETYLAARAKYNDSQKEYDDAFSAEQSD